jgi:hypothetical protein
MNKKKKEEEERSENLGPMKPVGNHSRNSERDAGATFWRNSTLEARNPAKGISVQWVRL